MTAKRYGTNRIVQRVKCYSEHGARQLFENFGGRSRGTTVEIEDTSVGVLAPNEWMLRVDYAHTCENSTNWRSDSARFVRNAMQKHGKTYRYEILPPQLVERIELSPKE